MTYLAVKGNREVKINEVDQANYEKLGFIVYKKEDDGKVALVTKKADPEADAKLIKKLEKTKAELEKENTDLKAKLAELEGKK